MVCPNRHKKALYESTEQAAKEYMEMNPNASMEKLFEYLGSPAVLVDNYMSRFDRKELEKASRRGKWVLALSIIGVALLLLGLLYIYMYYGTHTTIIEYNGYHTSING